MKDHILIYSIGFLAQIFFSARILIQWILSERAKKVLSPSLFWVFSLAGSYLLCIYGWLRNDFSIVLGQFISYYIYMWNLNEKGIMSRIPLLFRIILVATPIVAISIVLGHADDFVNDFFRNEKIPLWLLIYGSMGQIIFTLRFVYQLFFSYRARESVLPVGFWIISLIGSLVIVTYGAIRLDPVLILGQSFGVVAYIRNLFLGHKQKN